MKFLKKLHGVKSYLKDGNIGISVRENIRRYKELGSLQDVLNVYLLEWKKRPPSARRYAKAQKACKLIETDGVRSFRELCVLSLWVDAAPDDFGIREIESEFGSRISELLVEHKIE